MVRWIILIGSFALLVALAVAPVTARDATPAATPAQAAPIEVKVTLDDFTVTLARTALIAGQPYRFVVTNGGAAAHEFVIEPGSEIDKPLDTAQGKAELEDIGPGQTKKLAWTFSEPGEYQMACHVPGHFEAGMKTPVDVAP